MNRQHRTTPTSDDFNATCDRINAAFERMKATCDRIEAKLDLAFFLLLLGTFATTVPMLGLTIAIIVHTRA